ncbi:MAG TPA: HAD-IC family P-type ATPase [Candidatus Lokiarchaeia archaeon]|nr:HAD-IC family P-type ATPase [Candidatus Lokiarchaeia archaeon]
MGRVSVIFTDKTGTLTQNEMTVTHVYADGKIFDITGVGYSKEGSIEFDGRKIGIDDLQASETLKMLVLCGLIDNNAEITEEDYKITIHKRQTKPVRKVIGDPMEGALIVLAEKMGIQRQKQFGFIKEFPFDAVLKRMTKIYSLNMGEGDAEIVAFSKGATEFILNLSTNLMENGSEIELDQNHKSGLQDQISSWSEKGYRTLGLALKHLKTKYETKTLNRAEIEKGLTFLGFVVLLDPIRQGVKEAVKLCKSAGIKVVMITGDHPKTAETIGSELEIFAKGDLVVEGKDISTIDEETFFRTTVFARVSPGGKQIIVKRYQDAGKVVAMTGDGVNDALALGMADAGLAMGISGTDVAKEAADMIISDDSFSTIVKGIHTGRGLFAKIRVIIYFFVYANLTEAMFIFITGFINPNFYLIDPNIQIYIIYGLSHALIPFGLTFDRTGPYVMAEKPRNEEEIFNKNIFLLMAVHIILLAIGLLVGASFVISAFYANPGASDLNNVLAEPRTITIGIILVIEVLTAFSIRRQNVPLWRTFKRNDLGPFFVLMAEVALGAFIFCVYIPFFQKLFLLAPLTATDWLIIFGVGLPTLPILELVKWFMRVKKKLFF